MTELFDDEPTAGEDAGEYTAEEMLEQAQINTQALFLGTAAALANDPAALEGWRTKLAATFIRAWDTDQPWEPADILFALLVNYQAFGGEVVDAQLDAPVPFATLVNLPNPFLAEALDVAPGGMEHLFRIGEDLTARLGGKLIWSLSPEFELRLEVTGP
jgi:hypothetical protein